MQSKHLSVAALSIFLALASSPAQAHYGEKYNTILADSWPRMAENRGTIQFISTHKLVLMPPDGHRIVLMSPHMGMNPLTQGFKVGEEVVVVSDAKCFALKVSYPDKVIVSTLSVPEAMVPLAVTPIPVVTPSPIIPRPVEPVRGMW